jgi:hypothetical protein
MGSAFTNGIARNVRNRRVDALKEQGKELQEMCTTEKSMHSKKTSRETFLLGSNEKKHSFANRMSDGTKCQSSL